MREKLLSKLMLLLAFMLVGAGNAWADDYVKVTSTSDITGGQYLIVYEDGNFAMNGGLTDKLDAVSNTIAVTIQDAKIASNANTDAAAFTYDATAKTFQSASGLYMGQTSDANGMQSSTEKTYENAVSIDADGNAEIVSGGAYLRYNSASNQTRFRYYKSSSYTNQKTIQLYKLTTGGETSTVVATTVTIDATGITNTNLFEGEDAGKLTAVVKAGDEVIEGAVVAWESDNKDVASVGNDGTVTLESAGTAVITASYAGVKDQYKPSEATYTLTVTNDDPNGPGTADNPYTVAQAVAAIDAGVGVKAIYVKGIISQLDSYNSTYKSITYWISADGTTTDQFEVYSGRGLDNTDFAALTDLKLGDEVVIYGNIKKYGDVYELDKENYIVSLVRAEKQEPGLAYETTLFTINVGESFTAPELTNPNNLTVTYTSSNESVATVDANTGAVTLANGTGVTTIKAKFEGNDNYFAGEASYTLEVVDPNVPGKTVENAYTVAQARAAIDAGEGVTGVYAKGIVSKIVTAYNSQYGNITYNISEDGSTTADQLQAFRGFSYDGAWFTSTEDIQVGDEVVVYGDLTKYNSTYEFGAGNRLVSLVRPQIVVAEPTFSVAAGEVAVGTKVELVQKDAEEIWYTTDGTDPDFVTGAGEIYTEPIVVNETTTIKAIAVIGNYQSTVASATYTVVEVQPVAEYATLPFKFDGKVADIEGTEGLTHEGIDASDYKKSPYLKFKTTGAYMVLKIDEVPGALTFDIQGNSFKGGTFSVQTSADGLTYTDVRTYSALLEGGKVYSELVNLKSDVRYIKWIYTEKATGNVGIGNIELVADYKARVGEAGYATFVAPVAVDFAASGLTAYAVTEANAQGVMLEEVAAAPAGTPVVLQADAADYVLTLAERPVAPATNLLRASDGTTKGDGTIFALGVANDQAGFYRVAEGAAVAADKAYLQIDAATGAVRDFLAFIGTADAIQQVALETENAPVYNLNGQRVQKAQRGIYVKNGRVFVVK